MFWKNIYFKVGIILGVFILALLIVLPKTPIVYKNDFLDIDTTVGGYRLALLNNQFVVDLVEFKKGLDLNGGVKLVLKADMTDISSTDREAALDSARGVLERRVNFLGVSEPYIVPSQVGDEYRIIVEIPGVENVSAAVSAIGQTAQLKFKTLPADTVYDETKLSEYYTTPEMWVESQVSGADLRGVDVVFSQAGSSGAVPADTQPSIQLRFTTEGRKKFEELAKLNVGKPIGIFLDEESVPLSMPVVSEDLAEGLLDDPIISGTFDIDTANALSVQIRAGALPVPIEILEQTTIEATLGAESVQKSLQAGVLGLILVLVFMVLVYGKLGIVADFALVLYALIVLAIFKAVPVVLTLPGIAGFLLSVGMAVDANILIFERVREEVSWGRPRSLAIKFGFERAWTSIRDSNVSSLITAGILFWFGTSAVRGFALTLIIGILVSLFTAIFVTRTLIEFSGLANDSEPKRFRKLRGLIYKIGTKLRLPRKNYTG